MSKKVQTFGSEGELAQALVAEKEQPYPVPKNWCWTRLRYVLEAVEGNLSGGERPGIRCAGETVELGCPGAGGGAGGGTALALPRVEPLYLHYYFGSELFLSQKAGERSIGDYMIPLPPLSEQGRIVTCMEGLFSRLNNAEANLRWLVDSDDTRRAVILQRAFAGELTKRWRKARGVEKKEWGSPCEGEEPTEEEKQAAVMVDQLFSKEQQAKDAAESALRCIERTRRSILDQAFRGELGTNDPAEEGAEELLKRILASRREEK